MSYAHQQLSISTILYRHGRHYNPGTAVLRFGVYQWQLRDKGNRRYVLCYPEAIQGTETDSAAIVFGGLTLDTGRGIGTIHLVA